MVFQVLSITIPSIWFVTSFNLFRYFIKVSFFCHDIIYIPSSSSVMIINSIFLSLQYSIAIFPLCIIDCIVTDFCNIFFCFSFGCSGWSGLCFWFNLNNPFFDCILFCFYFNVKSLGNIYVSFHLMENGMV